ncbi:MAG: hypothetical protein BGO41_03040 [Clostridiales bacterium 38-18]|nr:MAG: hypothetical protein BGO41_03040 [Clostridiales bacterium 38-18]
MVENSNPMALLRQKVLRMILVVGMSSFLIVALINVFNQRPILNVVLPLFGSLIALFCFVMVINHKYMEPIKYGFSIFICVLYLPMAWLSSPGSYSAMAFYAVLIFFVGIVLAGRSIDYIFPIISYAEIIYFLNYEPKHPEQYSVYSDLTVRGVDLSINFTLVSIIIFALMLLINNFFKSEHKRIYELSITDQLTGIYNRRHMFHELERFYALNKGSKDFIVLMMDLNNFKKVNDNFGHSAGDEVLKSFGSILNKTCRKNDLPVRYGGDEFMLILPNTDYEGIESIKARIDDLFQETVNKYETIQLSVGYGIAKSEGRTLEEVIQQADDHLYRNKAELKHHEISKNQ